MRQLDRRWLFRVALCSSVVLAIELSFAFSLAWGTFTQSGPPQAGFGIDFSVYWSAAVVALTHSPAAVFNQDLMMAVEQTVRSGKLFAGTSGPWLYPPAFLIFLLPLGMMPLNVALTAFSCVGIAAYLRSMWGIVRPIGPLALVPVAAFPGLWLALCYGQNSLLTAAAAAAALALLPTRPILAGIFIGLLSVKPQLGLIFPLALICSRQWRCLVSAAICSFLLWSVSALMLGVDMLPAWVHTVSWFRHTWIEHNPEIWRGMPTVYAAARRAGASAQWAYGLQAAVAVPACAVMAWLWRGTARDELKAAALGCCTLLVQPYLLYYDLAWLAIPIAFIAVDLYRHAGRAFEWLLLVAAWAMPLQSVAATMIEGLGHWTPAVLVLLLCLIVFRHRNRHPAGQTAEHGRSKLSDLSGRAAHF
ncbi:glycosyltransferase family 87 protein [Trinickia sp.]|uniref:glycosyltransferase family 87 protein n=1 Tax=Trinickia sp. TaxID=2571163 RepID=UPI003F815A45